MAVVGSAAAPTRSLQGPDGTDMRAPGATAGLAALQAPDGIMLLATEQVLLLAVDLPVMPAAQRRAAVGFSVEDRIAQPLDEVQVALGPQLAPGIWLVAVTAHAVLMDVNAGKKDAVLWPDAVLLPVPTAGWSVWTDGARAVVRLPDGTGFAAPLATLPAFWAAAGSPAVVAFGDEMPLGIAVSARGLLRQTPDPALVGFDLRAGMNRTNRTPGVPRAFRPLGVIALVLALAHTTLLTLDVMALDRLVGQSGTELRSLLNLSADSDLDTALAQSLTARQATEIGGVLELLVRVFTAIGPQAGRVTLQDLRYGAAEDAAIATIEARDLGGLQAVETALIGAGLTVTAGTATTGDGAAEVQMTIRGGGT